MNNATQANCQYLITPTRQSFGAGGGNGSLSILAANACSWAATSNVPWVTITAAASGSGLGQINFTVAANAAANQRAGMITAAGQTFTITQAGASGSGGSGCAVTPINVGQTINGDLTTSDCRSPVRIKDGARPFADRYSINSVAGQPVIISLTSANFDTYLYLFRPDGSALSQNDDSNSIKGGSSIPSGAGFLTFPLSGTFIIEVTAFSAQELGAYTLSLAAAAGGCSYAINSTNQSFFSVSSDTQIIATVPNGAVSGPVTINKPNCPNAQTASFTVANPVASVSAASFLGQALASESIVAAFGTNLAISAQIATTVPLPTTLAGTTVKVRDSAGVEALAPLFFVAPAQVNYLIPAGVAPGAATITITSGGGSVSIGVAQIANVAPGFFTANASGQGVVSAIAIRVRQDGSQSFEPVAQFDQAQNRFVALPIDLGPERDQVFLVMFGTGMRNVSSLAAASLTIGGTNTELLYVGAQGDFVGLDQINVRLPRSLIGRGEMDVTLTMDGKVANTVRISVK